MICKVTDFGFAKALEGNKKETMCLGTPLYMAPELVQRKPYDSQVDIWALGILTHIVLAGIEPFKGNSTEKIFRSILNDVPNYLLLMKYKNSGKLAMDFIKRCLQKNPRNRATA